MKKQFLFKISMLFIFPLCLFSQSKNKEIIFKYVNVKEWDNTFHSRHGDIYINKNNGETSDLEGFKAYRTSNNVVKKLGGQTWTCFNAKLEASDGTTAAVIGYKDDAVFIKYNTGKDYSVIYLNYTTNNINCGCETDIKTGILYCDWCNGKIINEPYHVGYDEGRCKVFTGSDYYFPKNYHQKCATEKCEKN